ncbi:hypothetical protein HME9304_02284 [Flagellimonas maritima]|uniref:Uncharacterized protein n=1 Tax=Flagellimonas maritima TaxID=1383885 RepID=A0A2Z4LU46_9FLAO|nr:hypothetical protein [Allomuricauda aurantiaca]AWX45272.1 hypothetical protein HME9304_02284 [Allomuricauda aurantiaca]
MDKLEKHIKEKLEKREIKPSRIAWEKISAKIALEEKPKRKLWYPYAIAAGFVSIIMVSTFLFKPEKINKNTLKVVKDPSSTEIIAPLDRVRNNFKKSETTEIGIVEIKTKDTDLQEPKNSKMLVESTQIEVVETFLEKPLLDTFSREPDNLIAQKVNEVFAQVELLEKANSEITDAEVDSLLKAAQDQILTEKLFAQKGTVDAMALLAEVEDELDGTFRNQIFDALKEGYLKLRTAVADRNN